MVKLNVNGQDHEVDAEPGTPLLYVLRDDLKLNAAKFGCGLGQCGACTVLVNGEPVFSCVTPIALLAERQITTLEGLGTLEKPAPIQSAFIEEQAAQCGLHSWHDDARAGTVAKESARHRCRDPRLA
jgi:nicotinate dehydrogenase subunit A